MSINSDVNKKLSKIKKSNLNLILGEDDIQNNEEGTGKKN